MRGKQTTSISGEVVQRQQPLQQGVAEDVWENAPRLDLVCRTFSAGLRTFWVVFFPTYLVSGVKVVVEVSENCAESILICSANPE